MKKLSSDQLVGIQDAHVQLANKYLSINGDNPISELEAAPLLEAFLVGYSIDEVADRFPHMDKSQIVYTSIVNGWHKKRQEVAASIYDRVKAKLIRSVVEQVDYMTDLLSVVSTESKTQIAAYLSNPDTNPPPQNRIRSMKEYKEAIESLMKLTEKISALDMSRDAAIESSKQTTKIKKNPKHSSDEAAVLAALVGDDE